MKRLSKATNAIATVLVALLLVATSVLVTYVVLDRTPKEAVAAPDSMTRVAIIGDSYSSGLRNSVVWPSLVAESSPMGISNFAIPGSGYVGGVGESGTFANQLNSVVAAKPDVVVVFGGINDVGKSPELITQTATDLFAETVRRMPTARVVVLGPLWHQIPSPEAALIIDRSVASAAEMANLTYVRLIDKNWLVGDGLIQDDGVHPSDAGQIAMARELGPVLQQVLRRPNGEET